MSRKLTKAEVAVGRSKGYYDLSPEEQWAEDKRLGILDWDGKTFPKKEKRTVPAANFMATIAANVDNDKMSDREFRQFIRNTLPIVQYDGV